MTLFKKWLRWSPLALVACSAHSSPSSAESLEAISACIGPVVEGVDVSDAQGAIDWGRAHAAGIDFAFMKATQGTYNTQSTFASSWANARAAGVVRGAYHFFDPTEDGAAQARHFLAVMGQLEPGDLPPMIDVECPDADPVCLGFAGGSGQAPPSVIRANLVSLLDAVEKGTGRVPIIYTSNAYFSGNGVSTDGLARYPLYIADPVDGSCFQFPGPWDHADFWQWSWQGRIDGIAGNVDRDRFLGTKDDLSKLARGGSRATHFEPQGAWLTGFGAPDWAGAGDFDGDGKSDVVWYEAWNDHAFTVALSTGKSFAIAGKWLTGFGAPDWAGVGDFDGDGKSDVAWYEAWNDGAITVALSRGDHFDDAGQWQVGFGKPDWAGVGDFDGDGKSDLAWYEAWNDHGVTIARSTGSGIAPGPKAFTGIGAPDWAGVGDFDGDGKSDLAWYESWNGGKVTLLGASALVTGWGKPDWAASADADGDGKSDLVWYEAWNDHAFTVASGPQQGKWLTGWGAPTWAMTGDFDGDGRADVAWYEAWNDGGIAIAAAR